MQQLTLDQVNALDQEEFTARLGHLFESSPWIVAAAWPNRPFSSSDELHQALCKVMYDATLEQQLALIRAHPDLVGRAALAGTLGKESTNEQASAGLDRLSPDEVTEFTRLNGLYHARFGFPFVICVRENKKAGILNGFNVRLHNNADQERETALNEIAKIAYLRLCDTVTETDHRYPREARL